MADPTLSSGQYSIGKYNVGGDTSALVYGRASNSIQIQNTAIQSGALVPQDQPHIGTDGLMFGVDAQGGMLVTHTGYALTSPAQGTAAMDAYSALAGKWNDPSVRLVNAAMQVLRASYPGSAVVRRAYGRGRAIQPALGQVFQGIVPFTAQFQAADNYWYSDSEFSSALTMPPSLRGTFTFPATPPYWWRGPHTVNGSLTVSGNVPTWPRIIFTGPVANPVATFLGTGFTIGYNGLLNLGQNVTIDTAPWARSIIGPGGGSAADKITGTSLINLKLQVGLTHFTYSGVDFFGTSSCTVLWRNAWLLPGGANQ